MIRFASKNGKWILEWEDIGEAIDGGEYPGDGDTPVLRATLLDAESEEIANGSYCTLTVVGTSTERLRELSTKLFDSLGSVFSKRIMQEWTWITKSN